MRNVKPKQDEYGVPTKIGMSSKKSDPVYPRIRFDLETLPEAKNWKVGKTYHLEMEVKMVGLSISKFDNSVEFEVRKIGTEDGEENDAASESEEEEDDE